VATKEGEHTTKEVERGKKGAGEIEKGENPIIA